MCLSTVDKKTNRTPGIGYKLVEKRDRRYFCWDFQLKAGSVEYKLNRWMEDTNIVPIMSASGEFYKPGFHIYLEQPERCSYLDEADCIKDGRQEKLVVIKVKFKKVVVSGTDLRRPVIIARKIVNKGEAGWLNN